MDELSRNARLARAGDRAAGAALIRASQAEVWRLCAHLVDTETADDLTQETYLRVFRALPRFRGQASARTWLLSIARRVCMDELRVRVRHRRHVSPVSPGEHADQAVPDVADEFGAAELLAVLEPDRRAAFVLTQLLGLSYEEAAQASDCPVGTIRSRVARARAELVETLQRGERESQPGTAPPRQWETHS